MPGPGGSGGGGGGGGRAGWRAAAPRLLLGGALALAIGAAAVLFDPAEVEGLLLWVRANKREGAAVFFSLYVVGVVVMLPAMVMAMAAGAVFGLAAGAALAWAGSSVGQVAAFAAGRYLLRAAVTERLARRFPKWAAVDAALAAEGWRLVALLRLSPVAPWNVLNYALAVTGVPLGAYAAASSAAIIPYIVMFAYFGSLARDLADVLTGGAPGLGDWGLGPTVAAGAASGAAVVGAVWYTTHVSRRAINAALAGHAGELPPEITEDPDVVSLLGGAPSPRVAAPHAVEMAALGARGGGGSADLGVLSPRLGRRGAAGDGERAGLLPAAADDSAAPDDAERGGGAWAGSAPGSRAHSPTHRPRPR